MDRADKYLSFIASLIGLPTRFRSDKFKNPTSNKQGVNNFVSMIS